MIAFLLLIAGFAPLIFGANILVDGASSLAKKFNIPNIVIGLTIVAFGTSAPELIVNVFASVSNSSDITLGNVIGSNVINILVILGLSAIIYPLIVQTKTAWIEIPLCFMSALLVLVIANDKFLSNATFSTIDRADGIILLFFFIIFLVYNFQLMKSGNYDDEIPAKNYSVFQSILFIIAGMLLLIIGGKIIVSNAISVAKFIGLSERIIAITIVSLGTSLPELATSAVAAKKKNVDIAVGNIVGSNIFNVFLILGVSSIINPIRIETWSNFDIGINVLSTILLFAFVQFRKEKKLTRSAGIVFIILYIAYVLFLLFKK